MTNAETSQKQETDYQPTDEDQPPMSETKSQKPNIDHDLESGTISDKKSEPEISSSYYLGGCV